MQYAGTNRLALNNMNCHIESLEKVGIKGRTGSGKSSIISTLLRFYEICGGRISIDNEDIHEIGLHCLRSGISYISQTPFLMIGTVKYNLDPFEDHTEKDIIDALKDVQMWEYVHCLKDGINTEITAGNMLFSVGQKQLICLARAILKNNMVLGMKIYYAFLDLTIVVTYSNVLDWFIYPSKLFYIALDEATANIDYHNDKIIQEVIRSKFKH